MVEGVLAVDQELRITFYNEAFAREVHALVPSPEGLPLLRVGLLQGSDKLALLQITAIALSKR